MCLLVKQWKMVEIVSSPSLHSKVYVYNVIYSRNKADNASDEENYSLGKWRSHG